MALVFKCSQRNSGNWHASENVHRVLPTKEPASELMADLEQLAFTKGLLLLGCGKSTIRVAPPLVLASYDVDRGLEIFDECLSALAKKG